MTLPSAFLPAAPRSPARIEGERRLSEELCLLPAPPAPHTTLSSPLSPPSYIWKLPHGQGLRPVSGQGPASTRLALDAFAETRLIVTLRCQPLTPNPSSEGAGHQEKTHVAH